MRSKKELITLVLIIAVAAGYLFLRQADRLAYELPQLEKVDPQTVVKLAVTGPEGNLLLEEKGGQWVLMPREHLADDQKIDAMLATIGNLAVTTVVAEKSSDARYDLDVDHRIEVTAWDENKIVRQFSLGKAADTFRHIFVKLPGDNRVFHARDNFRDRFDFSVDALRDKQVLTVEPDQVTSIQVARKKETFEWIPIESKPAQSDGKEKEAPTAEKQWQTTDQKTVDHAKINRLLQKFTDLNCQSFLEPDAPEVSKPPVWHITLKTSDNDHTFTLYPEITRDEEKLWPAASSLAADPFRLSDWQAEDIVELIDHLTLPKKAESGEDTSKE